MKTYTSTRELNRNGKKLLSSTVSKGDILVITNNGKASYFIASINELESYESYLRWKELQEMEPEEIILEIEEQTKLLDRKNIPSLEDQLSDL